MDVGSRAIMFDQTGGCCVGTEEHVKNLRPEKRRLKEMAEVTAALTMRKRTQFSVYPIETELGREFYSNENATITIKAELLRDNSAYLESLDLPSDTQTAQTNTLPGRSIPLHVLLKSGSIVVGLASLSSLLSWIASDSSLIIINPFAALLILIATPFFYLMGRVSRK